MTARELNFFTQEVMRNRNEFDFFEKTRKELFGFCFRCCFFLSRMPVFRLSRMSALMYRLRFCLPLRFFCPATEFDRCWEHNESVMHQRTGCTWCLTPHRRDQPCRASPRPRPARVWGAFATAARELANALPQEMPIMRDHLLFQARKADLRTTGGASLDRAAARSSMD